MKFHRNVILVVVVVCLFCFVCLFVCLFVVVVWLTGLKVLTNSLLLLFFSEQYHCHIK